MVLIRRLIVLQVAGIVCEADFVFIPEWPPEKDWPDNLCNKLKTGRDVSGQRLNIIIVAEGAIDREGQAITCEMVKKVVVDNLKQDKIKEKAESVELR